MQKFILQNPISPSSFPSQIALACHLAIFIRLPTDLPPLTNDIHLLVWGLKGNFPLFWSISLMTFLGVDFLASWDIKSWIKLSMLYSFHHRCGTSTSGTATWSWSARPPSPPSTGRATRSPSRKVNLCHWYLCLKHLSSCLLRSQNSVTCLRYHFKHSQGSGFNAHTSSSSSAAQPVSENRGRTSGELAREKNENFENFSKSLFC